MPTYERLLRFDRDYESLSDSQRKRFRAAVAKFVHDLERGEGFRKGLRVKGVQGSPGLFELTWDADGRATFSYGESVRDREPHVVWHRVGTHEIFG
ncbi:MAG: hypothetical protein MSC30_00875 [Gaiellaceae bacterium MAG52_C11]|nr:hypothetical protein [Candidatus Gaiellasilicea maunaloa]